MKLYRSVASLPPSAFLFGRPMGTVTMKAALRVLFVLLVQVAPLQIHAEAPDDILVVAHQSVPLDTISLGDLKDIYLFKRRSWTYGDKIVPIHAARGSALRRDFRKFVMKMTVDEETRYWQIRKIQTGEGEPTVFAKPLKAVFKLKNSVSYVYRSEFKTGVAKVLRVIPTR